MANVRPRDLFDASITEDLQRTFVRVVIDTYGQAYRACEELFADKAERHDSLPIIRRGLIEQNWRNVANRADGVKATALRNKKLTSYYTEVVAEQIVLTQSATPSWDAMARFASFRSELARSYPLFPELDDEEPPPDNPIYAVLVHGVHPQDERLPGFVGIGFPNADWSAYLDRINLLGRFPDLEARLRTATTESVARPSTQLRPEVRRKGDQQIES